MIFEAKYLRRMPTTWEQVYTQDLELFFLFPKWAGSKISMSQIFGKKQKTTEII